SASSAKSGKFAGSAASAEIAASDKSAPATDVPSVEPVEQAPRPDEGPVASEAQRPEAPKPLWKKLQEDQGQSISTVTLYALEQQLFGQPLASERKGFVDALFEGNTQAYARVLKQLAAVDTWEEASQRIDHGTMFYHAARQGLISPAHSAQIGLRTHNDSDHGFNVFDAPTVHDARPAELAAQIKSIVGERPCYLTFDIDCLDPSFAPGTGTPVVGGLSTHQAIQILQHLSGINLVGMDVVEVAPQYDVGAITSLAAATVALQQLCLYARAEK
ncbi:MAG: hypothetical protein EBY45_06550, partial [Gammaproteobacteria bacterium]|nr:hypothetical protein [Gammaproteobacteria bacterium]